MALSLSSFHVTVSLWLGSSDSFSAIPYGLFDIVWLGPVFVIPGVRSLPFSFQLLFTLVEAVFMGLGALTVSLQFLGSMDSGLALSHSWHFLFCHLAVSSGLPIILW